MIRLAKFIISLVIVTVFTTSPVVANGESDGTLIMVGDVLGFNERSAWRRIFDYAGGEGADVLVIGTAHDRPRVYGEFAVRALERYGPFVELLPLARDRDVFGLDYRDIVNDSEWDKRLGAVDAVFFVGGAPQNLATVLFEREKPSRMAIALQKFYRSGGLVVGGIPGSTGVHTDVDVLDVLIRSGIPSTNRYQGLALFDADWVVDQHFYSPGRFAETLVGMLESKSRRGVGLGPNTLGVLQGRVLKVVGSSGLVVINLDHARVSGSDTQNRSRAFSVTGIRLSYLDHGDQYDVGTDLLTPAQDKLDGFELLPTAVTDASMESPQSVADLLRPGALAESLIRVLDGAGGDVLGVIADSRSADPDQGYAFRFYAGADSAGWLSVETGAKRYTLKNIRLDITGLDKVSALASEK